LFTYDTSNATRVAATLALDPGITADQLAAIDPGPPYASNGTALKLAGLANPQDPADQIDNVSYVNFYGNLAAGVGQVSGERPAGYSKTAGHPGAKPAAAGFRRLARRAGRASGRISTGVPG